LTEFLISRQEYETLLGELKQKIRSAQLQALRSVNREQFAFYLDIGRMIMDRQRGDTWGKAVVGNLANDLREEFPGLNGFSAHLGKMPGRSGARVLHSELPKIWLDRPQICP
jgi:hypothetical protein